MRKVSKVRKNALLLVEWQDAASFSGWQADDVFKDDAPEWAFIYTVGWHVRTTDRGIYLAQGRNKDDDYIGATFIPVDMITTIKEIK